MSAFGYFCSQANIWSIDEPREKPRPGNCGSPVRVDMGLHRRAHLRHGGWSLGLQPNPVHRQAAARDHQEWVIPKELGEEQRQIDQNKTDTSYCKIVVSFP